MGLNDDWLQPPTVDPASITLEDGQYFVTCCMPDDEVTEPECNCCYTVSIEACQQYAGSGEDPLVTEAIAIAADLTLTASTTAVPCKYDYALTRVGTHNAHLAVSVRGDALFLSFKTGGLTYSLKYVSSGADDLNCGASRDYAFDSGFVTTPSCGSGSGSAVESLTSEAGTVNICGADYNYSFPATITASVGDCATASDVTVTGDTCEGGGGSDCAGNCCRYVAFDAFGGHGETASDTGPYTWGELSSEACGGCGGTTPCACSPPPETPPTNKLDMYETVCVAT